MRLFLYLSLLGLVMTGCQNEKSVRTVVENFIDRAEGLHSLEYDVHYQMKYLSSDEDTLHYHAHCQMIREPSDSIFGGLLWIENDSMEWYYDLENIYIIDHEREKIMRYFPHQGQAWAITGNSINGVLKSHFLEPEKLEDYLRDSSITATLRDSSVLGQNFQVIRFLYDDAPPITNKLHSLFLDESNSLKLQTFAVKDRSQWQYNEWHFTGKRYNKLDEGSLKNRFDSLAEIYPVEDHEEPDPETMKPLTRGKKAPAFKGLDFHSGDSVQVGEFESKLTLLDFWYQDCAPCTASIPFLSTLRAAYPEDRLLILGLNPLDNSGKKLKRLPKFIEDYEMSYPTVFVDEEVTRDYSINYFPTFYAINQTGEIIFSHFGYDERAKEKIDSLVESQLGKSAPERVR